MEAWAGRGTCENCGAAGEWRELAKGRVSEGGGGLLQKRRSCSSVEGGA